MTEVCSAGFPHSEISGSKDICSSPKLIAAYHVFLRLLVPRHPPCALIAWPFAHHPSVGDAVFWFSLLIFVCSHRLNRCLPILRFNVCIKDIWLNFNQIYMYAVFKVHCITLTDILSVIRNLKHQISSILKPLITGKTSYHNSTSLLIGLTPVSRSSPFTVLFPTELTYRCLFLYEQVPHLFFSLIRRPPALPHRLQCSTIGRLRLNRRVRDGNGCFP